MSRPVANVTLGEGQIANLAVVDPRPVSLLQEWFYPRAELYPMLGAPALVADVPPLLPLPARRRRRRRRRNRPASSPSRTAPPVAAAAAVVRGRRRRIVGSELAILGRVPRFPASVAGQVPVPASRLRGFPPVAGLGGVLQPSLLLGNLRLVVVGTAHARLLAE